ncbi:MAG: LAGLIDADG family homing endonuclease [Alphaproteobacteria bacterium]
MSYFTQVSYSDTGSLDAFSRLRTSNPETLFAVQSQYDTNPIEMEGGFIGTGTAAPTYSTSTRMVALTATAGTGSVFYQSYQYSSYQPGKALKHGEPVLTVNGWVNIEDIKLGDTIFDGLGKETKVIGVFPQGERKIYRITFDDGTHVDCDGEHLWKTIVRWEGKAGQERVLTTNQMLDEHGEVSSSYNRWRIPASPVLEITEKPVPIDAYTLGAILGDGSIDKKSSFVQFTTADLEILSYLKCDISKYEAKYQYGLLGLAESIRTLKLDNTNFLTKFVPNEYLYNSKEIRLAILQGLMDTDGTVDKVDGTTEYNSASKQLAEDVAFLVRSLGGQAKIKIKEASYKNEDGDKVKCSDSYRVRVIMPICPFKLERKSFYWKPRTRISFDRYIHSIKELGDYQATCIRVESEDHTFLTRNNIVTHNSQFIALTGVVGTGVAGAVVDYGYGDSLNGIFLRQSGTTMQVVQRSNTSGAVVETVISQSAWNLDKMDGTGNSGITFDVTKAFILIMDLQFLGMGRVRFGFDINGVVYYFHQIFNANVLAVPYMQQATLPISVTLTTTATIATKTCYFKCATVQSEGGSLQNFGYNFATPEGTVTAGNGARTSLLALRPLTTFNGIPNRSQIILGNLAIAVTGTSPIFWELCTGAVYTVAPTFASVNAANSSTQYGTGGTFGNLTTGQVIASGYVTGSGAGAAGVSSPTISLHNPIALNRAGAVTALGTLSLLVSGIGGNSATRASFNFAEIR